MESLKQSGRVFQQEYSELRDWALARKGSGAVTQPTAILSSAWVGPGGRRATAGAGVNVQLMNVRRWSATDFASRRSLLETVISHSQGSGLQVVLTPAGYFGWNTVEDEEGRAQPADFDRERVVRYLQQELVLPDNLLLVVGVDWPDEQRIYLIERGRPLSTIVRDHTPLEARLYSFGGLTWLCLVCGEFQGRETEVFGMIRDHHVDVVLDPAHVNISGTVNPGRDTRRFPFETFLNEVSAAGAAGFLAHHHPDQRWPGTQEPKAHSFSTWGIFAGSGADSDWMAWDPARGAFRNERDLIERISASER